MKEFTLYEDDGEDSTDSTDQSESTSNDNTSVEESENVPELAFDDNLQTGDLAPDRFRGQLPELAFSDGLRQMNIFENSQINPNDKSKQVKNSPINQQKRVSALDFLTFNRGATKVLKLIIITLFISNILTIVASRFTNKEETPATQPEVTVSQVPQVLGEQTVNKSDSNTELVYTYNQEVYGYDLETQIAQSLYNSTGNSSNLSISKAIPSTVALINDTNTGFSIDLLDLNSGATYELYSTNGAVFNNFAMFDQNTFAIAEVSNGELYVKLGSNSSITDLLKLQYANSNRDSFIEDSSVLKFSPDGKSILFIDTKSTSGFNFTTYILGKNSGIKTTIDDSTQPVWENSNSIIYRKYSNQEQGYFYKFNVEQGFSQKLVKPGEDVYFPEIRDTKLLYNDISDTSVARIYDLSTKQIEYEGKNLYKPKWLGNNQFIAARIAKCNSSCPDGGSILAETLNYSVFNYVIVDTDSNEVEDLDIEQKFMKDDFFIIEK